jgi:hypothetical protein
MCILVPWKIHEVGRGRKQGFSPGGMHPFMEGKLLLEPMKVGDMSSWSG